MIKNVLSVHPKLLATSTRTKGLATNEHNTVPIMMPFVVANFECYAVGHQSSLHNIKYV